MKKPTKTIKQRKRRIKGIVEDLRSGRYLGVHFHYTTLDAVATDGCKSTTPQIKPKL
jgi:alpha-D-ribose 1-methylphosphonate 5-triphosphate synthase subunit PhnI